MSKYFISLFVTVIFTLFIPGKTQGEFFISPNKAAGIILTPAKASKAEKFAAEEIQMYLKKITGVVVPITKTPTVSHGPAIIIGNHPDNAEIIRQLKAKYPIMPGSLKTAGHYDAFAVVGDGKVLKLVGQSETALLYAVWDWLESLGVRWIMPGEWGTFVPSLKEIELTRAEKFEAPGLAYRGPNYVMPKKWDFPESANRLEHGIPGSFLFSYRLRLNCNTTFDPRDSWAGIGSGHSYWYYITPERYFKDHPEWFNMINGKRQNGPGWQLCFTNAESAREFAKNISVDIAGTLKLGVPIERMQIFISPNDRRTRCECPECGKLADSDGSVTSMVTNYANLVAKEIRKTYPKARIVFYAYDNYARPGDHVKPGPGVCPELVFWTSATAVGANSAQPMFSDANEKFRRYFKQWSELSDQISAHTYYGHYTWFTPMPFLTQMAHDIPIMAGDPKYYGMYSESHLHWGTQGPNFYLHPKLMWNPRLDAKAVMDDYYAKGFGSAGPHIQRYYQILQDRMDSLPYIDGYLTEIPQLLTPDVVNRCNDCMDRAEKLLGGMDEGTRRRTNLVIQAWRNSAKTALAMRLFINSTHAGDREKIVKLLSEVLAFAETETGRWAFERRMVKSEVDQILIPLSTPLAKLPKGSGSYNFPMNYGGPIKFLGRVEGFQSGIWGYSLATHGRGRIDLPLRAEAGHKLTHVAIQLAIACQEGIGVKVSVSADTKGQHRLLADGINQCGKRITVPADMLGEKITLHIQAENWAPDPQLVLVGLSVDTLVQ